MASCKRVLTLWNTVKSESKWSTCKRSRARRQLIASRDGNDIEHLGRACSSSLTAFESSASIYYLGTLRCSRGYAERSELGSQGHSSIKTAAGHFGFRFPAIRPKLLCRSRSPVMFQIYSHYSSTIKIATLISFRKSGASQLVHSTKIRFIRRASASTSASPLRAD